MTLVVQAPEMDAVPYQALHVLEKLVFCPVEGRKKELHPCSFWSKTKDLRIWAMMVAILAPKMDAVPCRALHVVDKLVFCPVEGRKKQKHTGNLSQP